METPFPAFDAPPVEEVALGAFFAPLSRLKSYQLGGLRSRWGASHPYVDEMPELPPPNDPLLDTLPEPPQIQIELVGAPVPRLWFRNEPSTLVIQVQRDRLIQNWRRVAPTDSYPHYVDLRPQFERALAGFEDFVVEEGVGPVAYELAEVTYVNPIALDGPLRSKSHFEDLLAPWSGEFSDAFLPRPDVLNFQMRVPIPDHDGRQGTLSIQFGPVRRLDTKEDRLLLQIQANVRPTSPERDDMMRALDVCHEYVIRSFASMTTPAFHKFWKRTDVTD